MLFLISVPSSPELKDLIHLQVIDWYGLGLALKLNSYHLDIIENDFRGARRRQTLEMFDLWLKTQPAASYEQLIQALHEVGDERAASFLYKEYGKYITSDQAFSTESYRYLDFIYQTRFHTTTT